MYRYLATVDMAENVPDREGLVDGVGYSRYVTWATNNETTVVKTGKV